MNLRSATLRNTMFSTVAVYIEFALGMLTSIIIARHLGPDGYGHYSLVIWMVALGVAITNSGTATAAIKFVAEFRGNGNEALIPGLLRYLRRAQRIFMLLVVLAGSIALLMSRDRLVPELDKRMLLGFLLLAVSVRAAYMFNIGVAKGFENFRVVARVALVAAPVNLTMVVLVCWFDYPMEALLAVFLVSGVIFYVISQRQVSGLVQRPAEGVVPALPKVLLSRVHRHMWLAALNVSFGFLIASEIEVLFLNLYTNADAAGHFKVAHQLATGATLLVPGVFAALLLPMMASALSQGHAVAGRRFVASTNYLVLLAVPLVAFAVTFSDEVILLLYGTAYNDTGPVLAACIIGAAVVTVSQSGSSLLISADRQGSVLLVGVFVGIFKVALDVVLIKRYGLQGATWAYLVAAVVDGAAMIALAIQVSRVQPQWARLGRTVLAGVLAALLVLPLGRHLPPLAALLLGGSVLSVTYAVLTLLLRCWDAVDIEHMQSVLQRVWGGRPLSATGLRFLEWARRHTSE